jgi:hypothetical protein
MNVPLHQVVTDYHAQNIPLSAASEAYLRLLSLGHWRGRHTNAGQKVLVLLRDAIAEALNLSAEYVQNDYEAEAFKLQEREKQYEWVVSDMEKQETDNGKTYLLRNVRRNNIDLIYNYDY